jgi:hypothetical protein
MNWAYRSGSALLQPVEFVRYGRGNSEDGKDKGEECEWNQGEFVHCQAEGSQSKKGLRRFLQGNEKWDVGEDRRDRLMGEKWQKLGLLL